MLSHISWFLWVRALFLYLTVSFPISDALITLGKPVLSGPSISYVNDVEDFYCKVDNIQTNQTILYELFKEGNLNKPLGEYSSHSKEDAKFPSIITLAYDGRLICKASVQNNSEIIPTFSDWKDFQVLGKFKKIFLMKYSKNVCC